MRVVGVGSIWLDFAISTQLDNQNGGGLEILATFTEALEKIENISNVRVLPDTEPGRDKYWHGAAVSDWPRKNRVVPIFPHSWISFDIYIPDRIQKQISDGRSCDVETFHVDIYYDYYMPITYVSFDIDTDMGHPNPSLAIMIIRKLLEQRMNSNIVCGCVGPSPFHADFILIAEEDHEGPPIFEKVPGKALGYETIIVKCASDNGHIPEIFEGMNDVFSAFYFLTVQRSGIHRRTRSVMKLTEELLDEGPPGKIKHVIKAVNDGKLTSQISKEITLGRLDVIRMEEFIHESERQESLGTGTAIGPYFKEFRQIKNVSIWDDIEVLVKFKEDRRQKMFANISTLGASLLGGIIGAVFASSLTYLLTAPSQPMAPPATVRLDGSSKAAEAAKGTTSPPQPLSRAHLPSTTSNTSR